MMFADLTPTAVELAAWCGCLAFLVGLANGVLKLVDRMKDKPSPSEVSAHAEQKFQPKGDYATRHELRSLEQKFEVGLDKVDEKIGERFDLLDAKRSKQVAELHTSIREVDSTVQRLIGRLEK